ncbi:site-specific integrase [Haloferax volcanii]|uniref:Site-specific integrase n=1 Tax=Haloferax volcanii TaxID=2246 RepID=A0A558GAT6_HALVO|nr:MULTISPECIES: site-specific integrase [Haloferax]QIB79580.1 site-specific integrase [Haloferax alexandrinus]TVT94875.1 site-specific integrase [Haloferax volcanii]
MTSTHDSREEFADEFDQEIDPLRQYEEGFKSISADPFDLFAEEIIDKKDKSNTKNNYTIPIQQWQAFMRDRGRHPACPASRHVDEFLNYQRNELDNSKPTTKQKFIHLNRVFKFFISEDALPHDGSYNPFKKILDDEEWETDTSKTPPNLSVEDLADVLVTVKHWKHRALILIMLFLGIRAQEACNIELSEVNIQHEELQKHYPELGTHDRLPDDVDAIYFPTRYDREGNKSKNERILPIPDELKVALVRYLMVRPDNGKPWLFLSQTRHNQMGNSKVNEIWKEYFHPQYEYDEDDKYDSITSHFGRHYFSTCSRRRKTGTASS